MTNETQVMPAVALRGITILPDMIVHFDVSRKKSIREFIMMLIPSFMMKPCLGISGCFSFRIIRTSISLIVLTSHKELRRRIF